MNVQNVIQLIIVKNFLMENILENVFVRKAIMIISKIVFVKNAPNFGIFISNKIMFKVIHAFIITLKIKLLALIVLKIILFIIIIVI